jgi:hypothetical protein
MSEALSKYLKAHCEHPQITMMFPAFIETQQTFASNSISPFSQHKVAVTVMPLVFEHVFSLAP